MLPFDRRNQGKLNRFKLHFDRAPSKAKFEDRIHPCGCGMAAATISLSFVATIWWPGGTIRKSSFQSPERSRWKSKTDHEYSSNFQPFSAASACAGCLKLSSTSSPVLMKVSCE